MAGILESVLAHWPLMWFYFIFSSDVAPLSAPAFSFCFPLLNATLRESSGSTEEKENIMTRALQVVNEHSHLRADPNTDDIVIDEVQTNGFVAFCVWCLWSAQMSIQHQMILLFSADEEKFKAFAILCWRALFWKCSTICRYYFCGLVNFIYNKVPKKCF